MDTADMIVYKELEKYKLISIYFINISLGNQNNNK
jgi:hypothetical protein